MNQTPASPQSSSKHRWALGGLIVATTASVVLSLSAWAGGGDEASTNGSPPSHGAMMMMAGGGGGAGGGGMGMMPFGGRHLQRLLDEAKASDAQRAQIKQIADKAQADLKTLFEEGRTLHEQGLAIWAAPTIDANAAEALRQQTLAHHDKVSKRLLQAALDVGNVLTPEQRATIATQLKKHHEDMARRMPWQHRGHRHDGGGNTTGQQPEAR